MPGRKPAKLELNEEIRQELEKLVARHTTGQQKAQRARIILKAADGNNLYGGITSSGPENAVLDFKNHLSE